MIVGHATGAAAALAVADSVPFVHDIDLGKLRTMLLHDKQKLSLWESTYVDVRRSRIFVDNVDVVIGEGGTAVTVAHASITTATKTQSATGTLKTAVADATTSVVIQAASGDTFVTTADLIIGSKTASGNMVAGRLSTLPFKKAGKKAAGRTKKKWRKPFIVGII